MENLIFNEYKVTGLPLGMYNDTNLIFSRINYLFGANGSGKSLTLRGIIAGAKGAIRDSGKAEKGYFAQHIEASLNRVDFHAGAFSVMDNPEQQDLSSNLTPEAFYQHLSDHPEIEINYGVYIPPELLTKQQDTHVCLKVVKQNGMLLQ